MSPLKLERASSVVFGYFRGFHNQTEAEDRFQITNLY